MSFSRALWLRERPSPRGDARLWRLWESDWTAIRRTSVVHLPAWCRDLTADGGLTESRRFAITFLRGHGAPEASSPASEASPRIELTVAMRSVAGSERPLMVSPSLAIQRSLDELPAIAVAAEATSRLAKSGMLEEQVIATSLEVVSGANAGLLD